MYYKGANMLHTIRQVINDDAKFRSILQGLNRDFYHQTVTTQQVESYISQKAGIDFSKVFDQYLRTTKIPMLQYKTEGHVLSFKYTSVVPGFAMPLRVSINGKETLITPTESLKTLNFPDEIRTFAVDRNYYVGTEPLK